MIVFVTQSNNDDNVICELHGFSLLYYKNEGFYIRNDTSGVQRIVLIADTNDNNSVMEMVIKVFKRAVYNTPYNSLTAISHLLQNYWLRNVTE